MVLLNGECGGTLPSTVTFSEKDDYDEKTGEMTIDSVPIYQIIQEAVNHFGEIPLSNILINDVPLEIRQVMKWMGDAPLYQYLETDDDGTVAYTYELTPRSTGIPERVFQTGEDVGYIYTPFVLTKELIGNAGQTVCDILESIKSTLGNYEYFFDIWGSFVFQEKKNYLNTRQSTIQLQGLKNSQYIAQMRTGLNAYEFNNSQLIISINNAPKYENIKNDFIVWGMKKTIEGVETPIRYHLAIDDKPKLRTTTVPMVLYEDSFGCPRGKVKDGGTSHIRVTDWRTELYVRGLENASMEASPYFLELDNEWRKQYDLENCCFKQEYVDRPYELDYFLDFIEDESELSQYSIPNIGRRTLVLVDNTINCLFEPIIPNVIFLCVDDPNHEKQRTIYTDRGENNTTVDSTIYDNLNVGGSMNSALVAIKDLLYQHINYNESISITMVPIFHLEPNTRITVIDSQSGTNGDFIITSISIPLDINGQMSVSAIKAMEKI